MGVDLKDLIPRSTVTLNTLSGKVVAVDAYNALYQFLSIIRQPDGTPLKDRHGRVTSHLSGLLYRTINFLEVGIKPVYVFDGRPPEIKEMEVLRRKRVKEEAVKKYEEALSRGDLKAAKTYAQQTAHLTDEMSSEAKELLNLLGVPWVQAPSEGEAQAAYMTIKGDAYSAASQDYDSLLFGAKRLVRNLTISGKRKLPRRDEYIEVHPELIELDKVLQELQITREQLIEVAILIGTDYNPDGVKGVGPKTALKLIKTYGSLEKVLKAIPDAEFPVDPLDIKRIFMEPQVTGNYKLEWRKPDVDGIITFLCEERDFSKERVMNALDRILKVHQQYARQPTLESFFKRH
ncbi:MAG: flap endonuclease-1 [Candidatus Nezhaarchaeota archaeon]|nr:flap endonuclease-1 [Candidatus Nezhaarchaeota archaeon]MCX8141730.1 flap endonuclease-1 [Candidatus Nezhaarchaeota archaeon]MDW8050492.1 flap endonuclease-1 [Nitrososphaerota archaeon]